MGSNELLSFVMYLGVQNCTQTSMTTNLSMMNLGEWRRWRRKESVCHNEKRMWWGILISTIGFVFGTYHTSMHWKEINGANLNGEKMNSISEAVVFTLSIPISLSLSPSFDPSVALSKTNNHKPNNNPFFLHLHLFLQILSSTTTTKRRKVKLRWSNNNTFKIKIRNLRSQA